MCFNQLDKWLWRGNHEAVCKDHVKRPYFIKPESGRVLKTRMIFAIFYVSLSFIHAIVLGWECWLFFTNWNMFLTTLTFCLLFAASFKDTQETKNDVLALPLQDGSLTMDIDAIMAGNNDSWHSHGPWHLYKWA